MSMFTTFGTFSIAAGILLIFLIFVMLAAERRGELGIARAVGTRRGHLVQMFTFEGAAYDLIAAALGAVLGARDRLRDGARDRKRLRRSRRGRRHPGPVRRHGAEPLRRLRDRRPAHPARRRVLRLARERDDDLDRDPKPSRAPPSAPAPKADPGARLDHARDAAHAGRSRVRSGDAVDARRLADPDRARADPPGDRRVRAARVHELRARDRGRDAPALERVGSGLRTDLDGLLDLGRGRPDDRIGAVWVMVYNADVILGAIGLALSRFGRLVPVVKMAITYPLRARFRTGATLAMFTLVVFTLVTGTASSGSFQKAFGNVDEFGGGFQVRAGTSATAPIRNMHGGAAACARASTRRTSPRSAASPCSR